LFALALNETFSQCLKAINFLRVTSSAYRFDYSIPVGFVDYLNADRA
jgi:hypothetical protein